MRFLVQAQMSHSRFNSLVKEGTVGQKIQKILADLKPEAAYFTEIEGHRTAILIINIEDASKIPAIAEPWFLTFEADVQFRAVMTPEDLARSGLETVAKKWS